MKKLLTIFILFGLKGFGQKPITYTPMTAAGYEFKSFIGDSTVHIPSFCGTPFLRDTTRKKSAVAVDTCNKRFYFYDGKTQTWNQVTGTGGNDTTFIIHEIDSIINNIIRDSARNLQQVTEVGFTTTLPIISYNGFGTIGADTITNQNYVSSPTKGVISMNIPLVGNPALTWTLPWLTGSTNLRADSARGKNVQIANASGFTVMDINGSPADVNGHVIDTSYRHDTLLINNILTTIVRDSLFGPDTTYLIAPLRALNDSTEYIDTFHMPQLRYTGIAKDTTTWTDSTLITRDYLNKRVSTFTGGGGTVTNVTATAPISITGISTITPNVVADTSKSIGRLATFSDNALKVDSVTKNATFDSIYTWKNGTHTTIRDSVGLNSLPAIVSKAININAGSVVNIFGNSYELSQGATSALYGHVAIFNSQTRTTANNLAVAGRGGVVAATSAYANISAGNLNPTIYMATLNDSRRNGSNTTLNPGTFEKIKSCLRATIANNFLSSAIAANNAAVTTTGTWTTTSGIGDKASTNLSGLVRRSVVAGSTLTYTFSGSSLVIGTFSTTNTARGGAFTYSIDAGEYTGSYTPKSKTDSIPDLVTDNSLCPNAVVITNIGSGVHTIVITTSTTDTVRIDYFGLLQAQQICPPFIVASTPKLPITTYTASTFHGSDAVWNQADSAQKMVIAEFANYPVYFADINKYKNVTTDMSADSIHPNDAGYKNIANGILSLLTKNQNSPGLTGYIPFNSLGAFAGSSSLFWDNTNLRLGVGTVAPNYLIEGVKSTNGLERIAVTNSNTGTSAGSVLMAFNGASSIQAFQTGPNYDAAAFNSVPNSKNTSIIQSVNSDRFVIRAYPAVGYTSLPPILFVVGDTGKLEAARIFGSKTVAINTTVDSSAALVVAGSDSTAHRGALMILPTIKLTTAKSGVIENDTTGGAYHLLWTSKAGVRYQLDQQTTIGNTPQTLTDGATITWDASLGFNANVTIAATGRTLSITNPISGNYYTIKIKQDGTGSRTITTWPTNTKWPGGTAPTLTTAANSEDIIVFYYNGTNYYANYNYDFK